MTRAAIAAAVSLAVAGCGGTSKGGLFGAAATKACLEKRDRSVAELGSGDARLVPLGVGGEDATAILWSPKLGAIVFAPGADEAQQARRRVVEFARRNANAMAPDNPSELATSLTVEKNVLVLWRDDRPRARQAVLGCLR